MPYFRHMNTRRRATAATAATGGAGVISVIAGVIAGVIRATAGVASVVVGAGGVVGVGMISEWFTRRGVGDRRVGGHGWVARGAGRLLPATVRETYVEEWRGWLYDLRVDGAPWYRRLLELLSIVLAAPRLAVTLRLAGQRAVD